MTPTGHDSRQHFRKTLFLWAAALQLGCGFLFFFDALKEFSERDAFTWIELLAVIALMIGAAITIRQCRDLRHRNQKGEQALDAAIYRTSGVSNRAELVSLLIEEFIGRLQPG